MKKVLSVLLVVVMVFSIAGCSGASSNEIVGKWKVTEMMGMDVTAMDVTMTITESRMTMESELAASLGVNLDESDMDIFIEGNCIYQKADTAKTSPMKVSISGNTATFTATDGSSSFTATKA